MTNPLEKGWLKKNIAEIIAIAFLVFSFATFRAILLKEVKAETTEVISIIECVKGILFLIIGYYFGSSIGSKKKQELMDKREDEKPNP